MSNFITQVKDAEDQAVKLVQAAKQKSQTIIQDAKKAAQDEAQVAYAESVATAQEKLAGAKKAAAQTYSDVLAKFDVDGVKAGAKGKTNAVVAKCFDFFNSYINS